MAMSIEEQIAAAVAGTDTSTPVNVTVTSGESLKSTSKSGC